MAKVIQGIITVISLYVAWVGDEGYMIVVVVTVMSNTTIGVGDLHQAIEGIITIRRGMAQRIAGASEIAVIVIAVVSGLILGADVLALGGLRHCRRGNGSGSGCCWCCRYYAVRLPMASRV